MLRWLSPVVWSAQCVIKNYLKASLRQAPQGTLFLTIWGLEGCSPWDGILHHGLATKTFFHSTSSKWCIFPTFWMAAWDLPFFHLLGCKRVSITNNGTFPSWAKSYNVQLKGFVRSEMHLWKPAQFLPFSSTPALSILLLLCMQSIPQQKHQRDCVANHHFVPAHHLLQ